MILALVFAATTTPQRDLHILTEFKDASGPHIVVIDTRSIKATEGNRRQMETWAGSLVNGLPLVTYVRLDADCTRRVVRDATSFTIAPDGSTYPSGLNMSTDAQPLSGSVMEVAMDVACGEAVVDPKLSKGDQEPLAFTRKWLADASH